MEKEDGRKNNGGARKGAGGPKKEVAEQAKAIMRKAVRMLYQAEGVDITDEAAQVEFIKTFAQTPRGMQFVAEHLFGKAPQVIESEVTQIVADLSNVSTETLEKLEKEMNANKD